MEQREIWVFINVGKPCEKLRLSRKRRELLFSSVLSYNLENSFLGNINKIVKEWLYADFGYF